MTFKVSQPQAGVVQMGESVRPAPAAAPTYTPRVQPVLENGTDTHPVSAGNAPEPFVQHPTSTAEAPAAVAPAEGASTEAKPAA